MTLQLPNRQSLVREFSLCSKSQHPSTTLDNYYLIPPTKSFLKYVSRILQVALVLVHHSVAQP